MSIRMIPTMIIGLVCVFGVMVGLAEAKQFIYPEKDQSKEQQELDEFQCHKWAVEQTGVDPTQMAAQAPSTGKSGGGGEVVRGGAKGAALGAIGGAIAGDAGKGAAIGAAVGGAGGAMKKRGRRAQQEQAQQQAVQQQQGNVDQYNRANAVCLEGRGYKVG